MKHTYTLPEVLRFMGHLLETNPTTGAAARDRAGKDVDPETDSAACSFCLIGAKRAVLSRLIGPDYSGTDMDQAVDKWIYANINCPNVCLLDAWEPIEESQPGMTRRTTVEKLKNA